MKEKKKRLPLICAIVCILLVGVGVTVYFLFIRVTPYKFFKTQINNGITDFFEQVPKDDIYEYDISLTAGIKAYDNSIPQEIINLINGSKLHLIVQNDVLNKKTVTKLDSSMEDENLLSGSIFLHTGDKKGYLYFPEYYSSYLLVEGIENVSDDLYVSYDYNVLEKIIKEEVGNIIKSEDCSKEDGYYILNVSNKQIIERLKEITDRLRKNEEFIKAAGGMKNIEPFFLTIDLEYQLLKFMDNTKFTVKANDKEFIIQSTDNVKIKGTFIKDGVIYEIYDGNMVLMKFTVTQTGDKNNKDINVKFVMLNEGKKLGEVSLNINAKYRKLDKIDDIDVNNVKNINELTEEELAELESKLSKSPYYSFIQSMRNTMVQRTMCAAASCPYDCTDEYCECTFLNENYEKQTVLCENPNYYE